LKLKKPGKEKKGEGKTNTESKEDRYESVEDAPPVHLFPVNGATQIYTICDARPL